MFRRQFSSIGDPKVQKHIEKAKNSGKALQGYVLNVFEHMKGKDHHDGCLADDCSSVNSFLLFYSCRFDEMSMTGSIQIFRRNFVQSSTLSRSS